MLQEVTDLELSMGMSKDYEEAIRMVGDFSSFTESTFFSYFAQPIPSCRAARMCVWAVPFLVHGVTLLPPLPVLLPRRVWRIAAGWWVGADQPLRLTHQPTSKISLPEKYICANQEWTHRRWACELQKFHPSNVPLELKW